MILFLIPEFGENMCDSRGGEAGKQAGKRAGIRKQDLGKAGLSAIRGK